MTRDEPFYTVTMAKIHARQGNLAEAKRIYRYLLEKEPDRPDLVKALEALEPGGKDARLADLAPLFRQWRDLVSRHNRRQKFKTRL